MIKIDSCPHCNSNDFIKYGKYRNLQRYQCNLCKKTFNEGTGLIWHNTRKSTSDWNKYCSLMFSGLTIRQCARALNICIETSFKWRHKILRYLSIYGNCRNFYTLTALKHTRFKENFKGQKIPPIDFTKQRKNVFVLTSINKTNLPLTKISFKGAFPSMNDLISLYRNTPPNINTIFIPGHDRFSFIIAKFLNNKLNVDENFNIDITDQNILLNSCTDVLVGVRCWISKFRSVATKYLDFYLNWFSLTFDNSLYKPTTLSNIIHSIFCTRLNY